MAEQPPLNLFGTLTDPAGVLEVLREFGDVTTDGEGHEWTEATLTLGRTGEEARVTVGHNREYYAGPNWPRQAAGMANFFAQMSARPEVLQAISHFEFAINVRGIEASADHPPPGEQGRLLRALAARLDAAIFHPEGFLLDAECAVISGPGGEYDPDARIPFVDSIGLRDTHEAEQPSFDRVFNRALVLAALSARALCELRPDGGDMNALYREIETWVTDVGAADELEEWERRLLASDDGNPPQVLVNAVWRCEGLAVLAWFLGLAELPEDDELAAPPDLWELFGVRRAPSKVEDLRRRLAIESEEAFEWACTHYLMLNWRSVEYRVNPGPCDFVKLSENCWFGSFSLKGFKLIGRDLSIGGVPFAEAHPDEHSRQGSIAVERHKAVRWLAGSHPIYSEADTST